MSVRRSSRCLEIVLVLNSERYIRIELIRVKMNVPRMCLICDCVIKEEEASNLMGKGISIIVKADKDRDDFKWNKIFRQFRGVEKLNFLHSHVFRM